MRRRRRCCGCPRMVAAALLLQLALLCGQWLRAGGSPWATPAQEALDERNDEQIFRAIVESMAEWSRRARRHGSHRQPRAADGVCYPEVGCFSGSGVFGYLDMLPSPPAEVGTRFLVYGGAGGPGRSQAPLVDAPFANRSAVWRSAGAAFNASAPTKVIVHGFGSSCSHVWVYEMRSALMAVEDCNVICVDWESGASVPNYVRAAANTRLVGKQVALLLGELRERMQLAFERLHLIGFSLGAHVAGFAGAELANLSRITGLDPAGPLFESQDVRARLDSGDAMFVDVIHSNGENLFLGGLGSWQPMGHVDFYPNGGRMQKGCSNIFVGAVSDILWSASEVEGRSLCNHRRAYKFFTDSVSPRCHFPAFPCDSYDQFLEGGCFPCSNDRRCGNMGYYADRSTGRGALYLITRDEEPFCAHQYHVRLESGTSEPPVTSYGSLKITLVGSAELNETFPLTQKDDEQLRSGESLSRLLVPHPVMQEPARVQLQYTAYSGWWSSGRPAWPVRKLSLVDSFGKSMSVCKRDLMLESGAPITLPLYPGECNPPARPLNGSAPGSGSAAATAAAAAAPLAPEAVLGLLGVSPLAEQTAANASRYIPTPVVRVGDEGLDEAGDGAGPDQEPASGAGADDPLAALLDGALPPRRPWHPLDFQDGGGNSLEDSRAFQSGPAGATASGPGPDPAPPPPRPPPSPPPAPANTTAGPEIKEPVLTSTLNPLLPRDNSTPPRPEIREPVLSPRSSTPGPAELAASRLSDEDFASEDERRLWVPSADLNPPPLGDAHSWRSWELARPANGSQQLKRQLAAGPDPAQTQQKPSKRSQQPAVTLQFLPQRLAALLAQAERYARLTFAGGAAAEPSAAAGASGAPVKRADDPLSQRRAKQFGSAAQERLDADSRAAGSGPGPLVPLSHAGRRRPGGFRHYIPLHFPGPGPGPGSSPVTVSPEDLHKRFRSVKLERGSEAARRAELPRPVYRGERRR